MKKDDKVHITFIATVKRIVAVGVNHGLVHSEVDALRCFRSLSPEKSRKYYLINLRMTFNGFVGISRPCKHCALFVGKHADLLDTLFYTDENGEWKETEILHTFNPHDFEHISFGHKSTEERTRRRRCKTSKAHATMNTKKRTNHTESKTPHERCCFH